MLAVTDDELIIIDDYAIKGLIRENQEIKAFVEYSFLFNHKMDG